KKTKITSDITSGYVHPHDAVRHCKSLIDWHSMGNTITSIKNHTSRSSYILQTKHSLHGDEHGWYIECFKENFCSLFSVPLWVERGFCKEHRML
ncbi:hypothetical protein EGW08_019672, partial [Elysia chlorotica]